MRSIALAATALVLSSGSAAAQITHHAEEPAMAVDTTRMHEADHPDQPIMIRHRAPIGFSPGLTAARLELRAEIETWTCTALTPKLRELRGRAVTIMTPEDHAAFDSLGAQVVPMMRVLFSEQELLRVAMERSNSAATEQHQSNLHAIQEDIQARMLSAGTRFKKYEESLKEIYSSFLGPATGWGEEFESITERWRAANVGKLDESELRYAQMQCFKDCMGRIAMMIFLLPALDDCDLDDPTFMFPDVHNNSAPAFK